MVSFILHYPTVYLALGSLSVCTVSSRMLTLRLLAALTVHNLLREKASSAHLLPAFVDTEGDNDRMISGV